MTPTMIKAIDNIVNELGIPELEAHGREQFILNQRAIANAVSLVHNEGIRAPFVYMAASIATLNIDKVSSADLRQFLINNTKILRLYVARKYA